MLNVFDNPESYARERLAMLEERSKNQDEQLRGFQTGIELLARELAGIHRAIAGMRGFVAGMSFTFSLIGAGLAAIINSILHR